MAAGCWIAATSIAMGAPALSVTTLSFMAETRPTNDFLAVSSRLAEARAERPAIRAFARREGAGRAEMTAAFAAWDMDLQRHTAAADARLDVLSRLVAPADNRVVIDAAQPAPDLTRLAAQQGREFDAVYVSDQTRALERLVAAYKDFILNGDDEGLRALAVRDLPQAQRLLAEVRRLR